MTQIRDFRSVSSVVKGSILPIHVDEACSTRRDGVAVIAPGLPRDRSVCGDLDEFELDRLTGRSSGNDEPVRIVGRQHRSYSALPQRRPITEFHRVSGQKNVVAHLRRRRIVDRKRDRNELGRQHGELNRLATEVVEQRLRAARPEWTVVPVQSNETLAKKSASGTPWFSFTGNVKEDLQRIAHDTDADLVFAVVDTTQENSPGRGVGIWMRALSKDSSGTALVHAHVLLVLVDKNGTEITNRGGSNASVKASELGLNYDLSSLKDPQVQQRVSEAMRKQLETSLTAAAKHMGY